MVSVVLPVAGDGLILPNSSKEVSPGLEKDLSSLEVLGKEAYWSTLLGWQLRRWDCHPV